MARTVRVHCEARGEEEDELEVRDCQIVAQARSVIWTHRQLITKENRKGIRGWSHQSVTSIGGLDPSIKVAGVFCGYRRPQWRGQDCQLAAPTPESIRDFESEFPIHSRVGAAKSMTLDPSIEDDSNLRGYWQPL
ncbi:hypothetical protein CDL15_Pgr006135 [Punica granatum]|uniref:Uncharacterized protein n=1 Tax=Punica granatum TaxID=22663 RepID=A0A218VU59_PUNGR|nr:hypothetical protein CDL15_Pgr006135 [Punica granatum]PKI68011.1 hypothetical protein CRG98_011607 [Punica granatum]